MGIYIFFKTQITDREKKTELKIVKLKAEEMENSKVHNKFQPEYMVTTWFLTFPSLIDPKKLNTVDM